WDLSCWIEIFDILTINWLSLFEPALLDRLDCFNISWMVRRRVLGKLFKVYSLYCPCSSVVAIVTGATVIGKAKTDAVTGPEYTVLEGCSLTGFTVQLARKAVGIRAEI
ncbi:hypothetical protein, partial [Piscirickettsia litoralis]|uniref:hypothetical protein n=1 Tax=Piscirickettsia litoralis TaxID=1891921 RepID=UPI001F47B015